jgi:hypothetical protein
MKDETLIEMGMELARQYGPIFQLPGSGPRNFVVSGTRTSWRRSPRREW